MKKINPPKIILAPMAGITDLPFRVLCREFGADLVYSEMISATGIFYEGQNTGKSIELANSAPEDTPLAIQLFGAEPEHFGYATKRICEFPAIAPAGQPRRPEQIDINFGCPAKKVFRQESGCYLMQDFKKARAIVQAVTENSSLPVSIKIRNGIKDFQAQKFLEFIGDLTWQSVMIHGRTYEQGFAGEIDFDLIKSIKKSFPNKEVYANGGIFTPEKALETLEKTEADGLGIARGVYGNPWIFTQIKDFLKTGDYQKPSLEEIKKVALHHAMLHHRYKPELMMEMRKHLAWYFKGFPNAKKIRSQLISVATIAEIEQLLK